MSVFKHQSQVYFSRLASLTQYQLLLMRIRSGLSALDENDLLFGAMAICAGSFSCLMLVIVFF